MMKVLRGFFEHNAWKDRKMKYIIFLGDGMADLPIKKLGDVTPLQYANTPMLDNIASHGKVGMLQTVAKGFEPGSDVANLTVLGYDTRQCYTGRASLEAAGTGSGIQLKAADTVYRCNFVEIEGGIMKDYSAGHIDDKAAGKLAKKLNKELGEPDIDLYHSVGYRNIIVWHNGKLVNCIPPHNISDKYFKPFLPKGDGSDFLMQIMAKAGKIIEQDKSSKATDIWIWGGGTKPQLENFEKRFGVGGTVISAVDLIRGIGRLTGLNAPKIEGATGTINTNYTGKVDQAIAALKKDDFLFCHYEAADEASHTGDLDQKIKAIENFDHLIVAPIMKELNSYRRWRVAVLPDHATPIKTKTHTNDPVPYAILDSNNNKDSGCKFNEKEIAGRSREIMNPGWKWMQQFMR